MNWTPGWYTGPGVYRVEFSRDDCHGRKPLLKSESDFGNLVLAFYDNRKATFKVYLYTRKRNEYNQLYGKDSVEFITSAQPTGMKWFDFLFPEDLSVEPDTFFSHGEISGFFQRMLYSHEHNLAGFDLTDELSQRVENMLQYLQELRGKDWVDPEISKALRKIYTLQ